MLDKKLPSYLTYHNSEHTLYVLEKTIYIANKEGVSKNELLLLKIAALFHDTGYINTYDGHEEESCRIAKYELKNYNISKDEIEVVCDLIRATKLPHNPRSKLEMIFTDADLEYLSTNNFKPFGDLLFQEMKHFKPELTRKAWDAIQIEFLQNHKYHTDFCKRYKSHRKQKHLKQLLTLNQ